MHNRSSLKMTFSSQKSIKCVLHFFSPRTMSFYIAVSSFWTLCWCTKPNPQTLTPEISSRPEMSSWSILQSDITPCFTHLFEEWWNGRSELWQQFASLQRFSDRVASREGLRRTGWHSSRIEQMMRGDQFQLTDVSPRQSECQSHSVTRCVILLQEVKAILAQCLSLFLYAVFDYCNVEHEL